MRYFLQPSCLVWIGAMLILGACGEPRPVLESPSNLAAAPIIPLPPTITASGDAFFLDESVRIYAPAGEDMERIAGTLQAFLAGHTGAEPQVSEPEDEEESGIYLNLDEAAELGEEGYMMEIGPEQLKVTASGPAGLFYAVQTLKQAIVVDEKYTYFPTGAIRDTPEYGYRGNMLDVARHFFTVEEVKRLIDYLAFYKFNHLHLHLSDDQGWRIEIKSWPKLTEVGGSTEVGGGPGGFYTQEEYKDIVAYAQEHFITIVPEIDMPGHTNAALASYPELNCDGKATELYTGTRVGFSTLCIDKDVTYEFVNDVVREISEMTPGPYFHIGGDESHVTPMEDYIPFINRAQEIVASHGKTVIGWDEISHAELAEGTVVQYWAETENALRAIEKGAKVLMSPAWKIYLDMQYDSTSEYGLHWAAYIPVDSAYMWSADQVTSEISNEHILGIEAPLWSETVSDLDEAEYLIFPRLLGYSEIGWTPAENRNWEDYKRRLIEHTAIMEAMDIDFYRAPEIDWPEQPM